MKNRLARGVGECARSWRKTWLVATIGRVCWLLLLIVTAGCRQYVVEEDEAPSCSDSMLQMRLVWPPNGLGAASGFGVWCGEQPLAPGSYQTVFTAAEQRLVAALALGASQELSEGKAAAGERCLRLRHGELPPLVSGTVLQPAGAVTNQAGRVLACLESQPLEKGMAERPPETLSCDGEWVQAGFGCARLNDDQLIIQAPPQPLLWVISDEEGALDEIVVATEWDALVMPLSGASGLSLVLETIDLTGQHHMHSLSL